MKKSTLLTFTSMILASCNTHKEPLSGTRETFITLNRDLKINKHDPIKIKKTSPSLINNTWAQKGGNASHVMPNALLEKKINKIWSQSIGSGSSNGQKMISNIVSSQTTVFAMDATGKVTAHAIADGQLLWEKETSPKKEKNNALGGGLSFEGDKLIVTTSFGEVFALNTKDGKQEWGTHLGAPIRMSATLHNNKVFVITVANELHVFDLHSGNSLWTHEGMGEFSSILGMASPAVDSGIVIAAYTSGEFYALDEKSGEVIWNDTLTAGINADTVSSIAQIKANPIINNGHVYIISHGGKTVCNDLKTGNRLWQIDIGGAQDALINGDFLFFITQNQDLVAVSASSGELAWVVSLKDFSKDKNPIFFSGPILSNENLLVTTSKGEILFINIYNGHLKDTLTLEHSLNQAPIIVEKSLFLLSDNAILSSFK